MKTNDDLTQQELKRQLDYNPETGVFTRKVTTSSRSIAGSTAGSIKKDGYVCLRVNRTSYLAHRLAWLYVHGSWPEHTIDHIDRDPSNNRISNLREANHAENCRNRGKRTTNTSGYVGVVGPTASGKWRAQIGAKGKKRHLGTFDTPEEAHKAYCEAGVKHFGEFFNCGKGAKQ